VRGRLIGIAALVAVTVAVGSTANPASACACGMALDAEVSSEEALVVDRPNYEQIIISLDLDSEGSGRAAVVVPVPSDPEVEAVAKGDPLAYLDRATQPEPEASSDDGAVGSGAGVDVLGRETIGGYDVARLAAGDPRALDRWLRQNGYELPPGAEPILADYVEEGWRYVAIRLAPRSDGRIKPLRVGFITDEPVYPMRLAQLGTEPLTLTLYTLADGSREVDGLETRWSGAVSELDPSPPPEFAELFSQGSYVTRMQVDAADPSTFDEDLEIEATDADERADDDEAQGVSEDDEEAEDVAGEGASDDGDELSIAAIALILAAAASVLAAAVAYRVHRDD
jgi:hypothetical protein